MAASNQLHSHTNKFVRDNVFSIYRRSLSLPIPAKMNPNSLGASVGSVNCIPKMNLIIQLTPQQLYHTQDWPRMAAVR
jgi:hypothetical protein